MYFDETETEEEDDSDVPFYETREKALKWINISNLIIKNASYFKLNTEEANLAVCRIT